MNVTWEVVAPFDSCLSNEEFWSAINVWNCKPHLLNKRVSGVKVIDQGQHADLELVDKLREKFIGQQPELSVSEVRENVIESLKAISKSSNENSEDGKYSISVKILCPKTSKRRSDLVEITAFDESEGKAYFFGASLGAQINYGLIYSAGKISLVVDGATRNEESERWLTKALLPAVLRWGKLRSPKVASLSLIPEDEYCMLYQTLKEKYGKGLEEIWTERTDPSKFIYEDINIAAYLSVLWKGEKVNFVDLGCGNGLLVHLLNSEGHSGVGIDVRERKIWSRYPPSTKLEVGTIRPSEAALFPNADWIIGNHSDELTPWIPIIAARSSYKCKFFLLPCCPYELNGQKYQRQNSSLSKYMDYIDHIESLCRLCGFQVEVDKLRIPSTKRICLIGQERSHSEEEIGTYHEKITQLLASKSAAPSSTEWISDFTPRQSEESVRNCTGLSKDFTQKMVKQVAGILLREPQATEWDCGVETSMADIAKRLPREDLLTIKKEHGGLKTLLKNHRFVFQIENDRVQLRKPTEGRTVDPKNWKKLPCWFYQYHPNYCPLDDEKCSFVH